MPSEIVLTHREALAFGMACAVAGSSRDRREWTQENWEAQAAGRSKAC